MIYELRTYNLTANSVPEVERRFAEKIEARTKLSPLVGFWHTEIGPLNQIVHLWAYESLQQRADVRTKAIADGIWPPDITEFAVSMESDILAGSPVNDPLDGPREWGNLYELRMYTFPSGTLRSVMQQFSEQSPKRLELYPGCFFMSDLGQLNRFYQLWPYKDWAHRDELRGIYLKEGIWPPHTDVSAVHQLVRHMVPASFSPLH